MADLSLREHTCGQLNRLCRVAGFEETNHAPVELLDELLGVAGENRLAEGSPWPSAISDDTTPVEFSIAFDASGERAIRVLGETVAEKPGHTANAYATRQFLDAMADRLQLFTDRFDEVQDLFLPAQQQGQFRLWYSLIFRPNSAPRVKVYFNPQISGPTLAPTLVAEGLERLGVNGAYNALAEHALARGNFDQFTFFALDLDNSPRSRVKLYISHHAAELEDVERASSPVHGVDPMQIREFCAVLGGGKGPFGDRPLVSSYSFVEGDTDRPSNYSLYMPIRAYVPDDEVARARLLAIMAQYNIDGTELDRALAAVSKRPLRAGVGLIAHVALRLGEFGSGITVYLSSEAYGVTPPRSRPTLGVLRERGRSLSSPIQ